MTSSHETAIVFVHGIMGFSSFQLLGQEIQYFRSLRKTLNNRSVSIHFPTLPMAGTIKQRAEALARYLAQIPEQHIHLIAHSMGGLDSRYTTSNLDQKRRIKTLITIATPHRGTPLAEWFIDKAGLIPALGRRFASPGLYELTPDACTRFNQNTPNRPDVTYQSYAGIRTASDLPMLFKPWSSMLEQKTGANDCQVSKTSAIWGDFQGTLQADHLELIGWSFGFPNKESRRPFKHTHFYQTLINQLLN